MKKGLLGYYNYTVILTYLGMLLGFMGIVSVFEHNYFTSLLCLILAGVCDMFDGTVASTRKRTHEEKCFGIQIDSLSDLICFGVLPAIYVYGINNGSNASLIAAAFYVLCALVRLAYFNVDEQERQRTTEEGRKYYYGLPVTLSAMLIPIASEICGAMRWQRKYCCLGVLMAMAVCFLLPFRLKKPAIIGKICVVICGVAEFACLLAGLGDV